jgi:hypothetical protein
LRQQPGDPCAYGQEGGELPLSGVALLALMQEVLRKGRPFRFRAGGSSMQPLIWGGDVLTLAPLSQAAPRFGDVVAFVHPANQRLVVHRVIARRGPVFAIRGDNGGENDWVSGDNVLARVTRVEREGRSVRFGLGPERFPIALLSSLGLLQIALQYAGSIKAIVRRWID